MSDVKRFRSTKGKKKKFVWKTNRILSVPEFTDDLVWLVWCLVTSSWNPFSSVQEDSVHIYLSSEYSHFNTYYRPTSFPIQVSGARTDVSEFKIYQQMCLNRPEHVTSSWERGSLKCAKCWMFWIVAMHWVCFSISDGSVVKNSGLVIRRSMARWRCHCWAFKQNP